MATLQSHKHKCYVKHTKNEFYVQWKCLYEELTTVDCKDSHTSSNYSYFHIIDECTKKKKNVCGSMGFKPHISLLSHFTTRVFLGKAPWIVPQVYNSLKLLLFRGFKFTFSCLFFLIKKLNLFFLNYYFNFQESEKCSLPKVGVTCSDVIA